MEDSVNLHCGITVGDLYHLHRTGDLYVTMGAAVEQSLLLNMESSKAVKQQKYQAKKNQPKPKQQGKLQP